MGFEIRYYNANSNKDNIQFVTEFPCFLGHPVSTSGLMDKFEYIPVFFIPGYFPLILSAYKG